MKERNKKRKQAMREAKARRMVKKALHHDIANFLVDVRFMQFSAHAYALKETLKHGFTGYYEMRGRVLVNEFEDVIKKLKDPAFAATLKYSWTEYGPHEIRQKDRDGVISDLQITANVLLSRLLELAFNLDFED